VDIEGRPVWKRNRHSTDRISHDGPLLWQRVLDRGRKDAAPAEPSSITEAIDLSSFMDLGGLDTEDDESPAADVHAPGDLTAMEWAPTSDEDWSASVDRLPDTLADAILEKARRTPRANERSTI
jgi:hypothetical protein